jgi:hypothetical protein
MAPPYDQDDPGPQNMDIAYLTGLSALAGSAVGGMTSALTTWLNQRALVRATHFAREMSRREDVFKDFIGAASKSYGDAIVSNELKIQELVGLYAMISRMRLLSSPRTVAAANEVMRATIDTYFAPNKTMDELHEAIKSEGGIDPLKHFSEAARDELGTFTSP